MFRNCTLLMLGAHTFHSDNAWCDYIPRMLQWEKEKCPCKTNPSHWSPGLIKESVFKSQRTFVTHGFTVLVGSRNLERGEAAAREVGPDAHALKLDVTDQSSIAAAAERIGKEFRTARRAREQCCDLEYE